MRHVTRCCRCGARTANQRVAECCKCRARLNAQRIQAAMRAPALTLAALAAQRTKQTMRTGVPSLSR
jgi:hypothetical protein